MHVQDKDSDSDTGEKSFEEVTSLFHTMAKAGNVHQTYKMFNTKSFRESLSIPDAIWNELEPLLKEKITKIRAEIREKKKAKAESSSPEKLPS